MKRLPLVFTCLFLSYASMAQLKTTVACPGFDVDILDGKVNGFKATVGAGELKAKFPCFTSATTDSAKCGESVVFKDKDIKFFGSVSV